MMGGTFGPLIQGIMSGLQGQAGGSPVGQGIGQFTSGMGGGIMGQQPMGTSGPQYFGNLVGNMAQQSHPQGDQQQQQMQMLMQLLGGLRR
jgi:hypothetical protein